MRREYPNDPKELDKEMKKIYSQLKLGSWITFYGFDILKKNQNVLSKKEVRK